MKKLSILLETKDPFEKNVAIIELFKKTKDLKKEVKKLKSEIESLNRKIVDISKCNDDPFRGYFN